MLRLSVDIDPECVTAQTNSAGLAVLVRGLCISSIYLICRLEFHSMSCSRRRKQLGLHDLGQVSPNTQNLVRHHASLHLIQWGT